MHLKEQFVPYDLAVKLKEKGFNEICIALITEKDFLIPLRFDDEEELEFNQEIKKHNNVPCIPTPLWKQAIDWLLNNHLILVCQEACVHNIGNWAAYKFVFIGSPPEIIILRQEEIKTAFEESLKLI